MTGLSAEQIAKYYADLKVKLTDMGLYALQPFYGKEAEEGQIFQSHGYTKPIATDHAIFKRDHWMVRQSDIVYANLLGADRVSIGSMMELAWGYQMEKHVVLVMEKDNVHKHCFVHEAADVIFDNTEDALEYLSFISLKNYE
jgi:nucleoside 2-deoxyribosyltransferase